MIPDWAEQYIGLPFHETASSYEDGFNCWTLARAVQWEQFAVEMPLYDVYESTRDVDAIERTIREQIVHWTEMEEQWLPVEVPTVGSLTFFRMSGRMVHVGTVLDDTFMLHVLRGSNACLGRYNDPFWRPKQLGCYQHIGRML